MNISTNTNTLCGIIEYRGRTIAAHVPVSLLTLDALSYSMARVEALRVEAVDPDYTSDECRSLSERADWLENWIDRGCEGTVPFTVDVQLSVRSAFHSVVVMHRTLDVYLDQILSVSTIVPMEQVNAPAFTIRNKDEVAEIWLTDNRALRNARLHPGPDVRVVETSVKDIKATITTQKTFSPYFTSALAA